MIRPLLSLGSIIAIVGCAHVLRYDSRVDQSLLPPEDEIVSREKMPDNERWYLSAKEAQRLTLTGDMALACQTYSSLHAEKEFPLREWALIKAHEICPVTTHLESVDTLTGETPYWFEMNLLRIRMRHFESLSPAKKIQTLWDRARLEKDERAREQALMDALGIAETLLPEHAEEARQKLWKNSPRLQPNPPRSQWRRVAADHRRWREFSRAIQLETRLVKSKNISDRESYEILKSIRQTHKISQNKKEMLVISDQLVALAEKPFRKKAKRTPSAEEAARLLDARVSTARAWWTENRRDLGRALLEKCLTDLQGKISLEEVHWLLGRMHEETGDLESALKSYDLSLKEPPLIAGLREKTLWFKAWSLYKAERREEAIQAFDEIIATVKDGSDKNKAQYWRARSLADESARNEALLELRRTDPLGFYGQLTYRDLNEPLPPLRAEAPRGKLNLWLNPEIPLRPALVAEWLLALDEKEGPVRVLETLNSDLRRSKEPSADALLRVASAYARAGEFLPLFVFMGSLQPEMRDQLLALRPDLLFPEPWRQEVTQASRETLIPPELIYAIMRQESAFNPRARSHAEAYGLMQLLPSVARQHARKRQIAYSSPEDLYAPETSIRLGASEIRGLMDKWQGQWIPAVASYNASERAVRGWLRHRSRPDPVEFIEEIPYEETKGYVKLVMRNQIFYQRLLAATPTPFPIKVLDLRIASAE